MEFGKIITRGLDKDGNFNEIEENIVEKMVNFPISRTVEIRVKVRSHEEELAEYEKFSEEVRNNPDIVRPSFKLETSRTGNREGYYFVIKCYTKLERLAEA